MTTLLTGALRDQPDVIRARQQARRIAERLGFSPQEQTAVAAAVAEIALNALRHGGGGTVEFLVEDALLLVRVSDRGPGIPGQGAILNGRSAARIMPGIGAARRLVDRLEIDASPEAGTQVLLGKTLPGRAAGLAADDLARIAVEVAQEPPPGPVAELLRQNRELLDTLEALEARQAELAQLSGELEETNRGVVALYAELDEKAAALRRASELKSRFLSHMSHEFRTPLNSIVSLSRILLDGMDGELSPEQEKQVTFIRRSADQLAELVNDLLDLAKIEAGRTTVRAVPFEVAELFGALRGVFRPLVSSVAVALHFDDPAGVSPLFTDEGKVGQILRNFISNALKFTERGEVRVSAARGPDDTVLFRVADTGIGIAAEDQERIFEEFSQVDSAIQRRVKGTGLGLPLTRKLAELLGGSVSVTSAPGSGSTFVATLPRVLPGAADEAARAMGQVTSGAGPQPADAPENPKEKLLLIDDDEVALYLLKGLLRDTGYPLIEATNGREGLRKAREERPRAIFLDLVMPDITGLEVLERLKSDPATRDIPVIIHSSKRLEEPERSRLASAAVAILSKESPSRELALAGVAAALAKAGLTARSPGRAAGDG